MGVTETSRPITLIIRVRWSIVEHNHIIILPNGSLSKKKKNGPAENKL